MVTMALQVSRVAVLLDVKRRVFVPVAYLMARFCFVLRSCGDVEV